MVAQRYTLEDFTTIAFAGFEYKLPNTVLTIVNKLNAEFGVTLPPPPEIVDRKPRPVNRRYRSAKQGKYEDENWEKMREFKTTKLEKKEGVEKQLNDIRIALNKISTKNYDTQRDLIFQTMRDIVEQDEDSGKKVSAAVIETASTNKFYSGMYAILFKELLAEFSAFRETLDELVPNYLDQLTLIQNVGADADYDQVSENNKKNDRRKSISTFIVNLMKENVFEISTITGILLHMLNMVSLNINDESKNYHVDELTENIFILTTTSLPKLLDATSWPMIHENIMKLSKHKPKDCPGISSRAIFKYMDILDGIKRST